MSATPPTPPVSAAVRWLICIIASIGFAFDIYELLMLPLILRPALLELGGIQPGTPEFAKWLGLMFYVPAFAGGIIGLFGGYLTDRLGRRRVLTWSILLYAFSAFAAGYSTSLPMLLFLRCTTFVGVCVEFVAAVAWLAELFEDRDTRERVLGYTQAFSSIGGLLVAGANTLALKYSADLPAIHLPESLASLLGGAIKDPQAAWRYTLMSGLIPAIPLIVIRPFLPESPAWQRKKIAGTLRRPSIAELFSPELRRTTIVTTIMFACSYGAAFGALQQMPQIVPGFTEVRAKADGKSVPVVKKIEQDAAADYAKYQEVGGLVGRFLLAMLAVAIVGRRKLLRLFQIPGLLLMPLIFWSFGSSENATLFKLGAMEVTRMHVGIFVCGLFTVAQFSFWGNYLPRVYPLALRGTGESFAANIGGRLIGTCFAWVAVTLATSGIVPGGSPPTNMAHAAAMVAFGVYLVGLIASFWLPEPKTEALSE